MLHGALHGQRVKARMWLRPQQIFYNPANDPEWEIELIFNDTKDCPWQVCSMKLAENNLGREMWDQVYIDSVQDVGGGGQKKRRAAC